MGIKFFKEISKDKKNALFIFVFFVCFYLFFQSKSIHGGDGGDLVTAAWLWGVPHAPGYPLYTLIAGILVHLLPFYTPAWRVSLISSFSSAAALSFFWLLLKKLTKKNWLSFLGTLTLAFVYPFWLYSEVPEVFALNNFFVIVLLYLGLQMLEKYSFKKLVLVSLIFGLGVSHHHTLALLVPSFIYIFKRKKIKQKLSLRKTVVLASFFLLGTIFYLYPPLACKKAPLVCWDNPTNLKNFIRLITRADYGTFKIAVKASENFSNRFYFYPLFIKFLNFDFGYIVVFLSFLGVLAKILKRQKKDFFFLFLNLFISLFFLFYANIHLVNELTIGIFERFLLIPYILVVGDKEVKNKEIAISILFFGLSSLETLFISTIKFSRFELR